MTQKTAAFLIIGNEILSGRTVEKNLESLTKLVGEKGIPIKEVRIIRDEEQAIILAVNALRQQYDYVFTSGGIGPTHDDITSASIAKAVKQPLIENAQAIAILERFYAERQLKFTPSRRRMARTAKNASIIISDFPGAPAFFIDNIFVLAGVPNIFTMMATAACKLLPQQALLHSQTIKVQSGESLFSDDLSIIDKQFPTVEIGSYPRDDNGTFYCHIVFSGTNQAAIDSAKNYFTKQLTQLQIQYEHLK